ncbi:MAG: hypothetical protein JW855_01890 [Gammaproteobacteria bacterium]|nr:hypothetical protein [Gammaproteobacteria bacterium]
MRYPISDAKYYMKYFSHLLHQICICSFGEVQEKMNILKAPKRVSYRPILIHVNGVTDDLLDSRFFAQIVDFSDFLV